jgi:hypothetical protein
MCLCVYGDHLAVMTKGQTTLPHDDDDDDTTGLT